MAFFDKTGLLVLASVLALSVFVSLTLAYNPDFPNTLTDNASIFGHSADELDVFSKGEVKTLQAAIDAGDFGGGTGGGGIDSIIGELPIMVTDNGSSVTIFLRQDCATDQVLKWDGDSWECLADLGGSGSVSISGTSGIIASPNPISGNGTLSADPTYLQTRVIGECDPGKSIRIIKEDGTVTCETDSTSSTDSFKTIATPSDDPVADSSTDTLTLVEGTGIDIVGEDSTDTITISATGGGVGGSGTASYLPKWLTSSSLGNSSIYDTGTNVGIGTTSPTHKLTVSGSVLATGDITASVGLLSTNLMVANTDLAVYGEFLPDGALCGTDKVLKKTSIAGKWECATLGSASITNDSLKAEDLQAESVGSSEIKDNSVGEVELAPNVTYKPGSFKFSGSNTDYPDCLAGDSQVAIFKLVETSPDVYITLCAELNQ